MRYLSKVLVAAHLAIASIFSTSGFGAEHSLKKLAAVSNPGLEETMGGSAGYARAQCPIPHTRNMFFSCGNIRDYWQDHVLRNNDGSINEASARSFAESYQIQKQFVDAFVLYDLMGDRKAMKRVAIDMYAAPGALVERDSPWEEQLMKFFLDRSGVKLGRKQHIARADGFMQQYSPEKALALYAKAGAKRQIRMLAQKSEQANPVLAVQAYRTINDQRGLERMAAQVGKVEVERLQADGRNNTDRQR